MADFVYKDDVPAMSSKVSVSKSSKLSIIGSVLCFKIGRNTEHKEHQSSATTN
jgi:hypothetical protein